MKRSYRVILYHSRFRDIIKYRITAFTGENYNRQIGRGRQILDQKSYRSMFSGKANYQSVALLIKIILYVSFHIFAD